MLNILTGLLNLEALTVDLVDFKIKEATNQTSVLREVIDNSTSVEFNKDPEFQTLSCLDVKCSSPCKANAIQNLINKLNTDGFNGTFGVKAETKASDVFLTATPYSTGETFIKLLAKLHGKNQVSQNP